MKANELSLVYQDWLKFVHHTQVVPVKIACLGKTFLAA
jgi:hypothetical protein